PGDDADHRRRRLDVARQRARRRRRGARPQGRAVDRSGPVDRADGDRVERHRQDPRPLPLDCLDRLCHHPLCRRRHDLGRHPRGCCGNGESVENRPMADEMWRHQVLAPYATLPWASRGRLHKEAEADLRSPFQRDRDRIIHSTAFRRLKHKTQVFVYHEGDHYRTRLTHSIEVAQIARSIARALRLDEDLTEALALGHDLGHTPFGHAGERELDRLMKDHGGFDHNAQSLRIVTRLERRYAAFDGLNLTWETLEGLVQHNGPLIDGEGHALGHYRESGLPAAIIDYAEAHDL